MKSKCLLTAVFLLVIPLSSAVAADGLNSGDTAWMIVSTALVMMMTPAGLALFYGGMSRYKNLLNTFAMTVVAYCLTSVIWMMWGYSIAFGPDKAWPITKPNSHSIKGWMKCSLAMLLPEGVC